MDRSKVTPYILKCSAVGASCLQLRLHKVPNLCSSAFQSVSSVRRPGCLPASRTYVSPPQERGAMYICITSQHLNTKSPNLGRLFVT